MEPILKKSIDWNILHDAKPNFRHFPPSPLEDSCGEGSAPEITVATGKEVREPKTHISFVVGKTIGLLSHVTDWSNGLAANTQAEPHSIHSRTTECDRNEKLLYLVGAA